MTPKKFNFAHKGNCYRGYSARITPKGMKSQILIVAESHIELQILLLNEGIKLPKNDKEFIKAVVVCNEKNCKGMK